MTCWILVADASRARLFAAENHRKNGQPVASWTLEQQWDHPASRAKGIDLATDAPGRVKQSAGVRRPAMAETTEPKQVEAEHFARQLAGALESGQDRHRYESLVLVAPPQFLGLLKGLLTSPVQKLLHKTLDKDYTQLPDRELPKLVPLSDT